MTLASASLTHNPISATALSSNPRRAASDSTALRTSARLAGSDGTFNSMELGDREDVIGRSVTLRTVQPQLIDPSGQRPDGSIIQFFCSFSQLFHFATASVRASLSS